MGYWEKNPGTGAQRSLSASLSAWMGTVLGAAWHSGGVSAMAGVSWDALEVPSQAKSLLDSLVGSHDIPKQTELHLQDVL